MVPPDKKAPKVPKEQLFGAPFSFNSGRFVVRPDPHTSLLIFLYLPLGFLLSLLRLLLLYTITPKHLRFWLTLSGVNLTTHGNPPPPSSLIVSNSRNPLDLVAVTAALKEEGRAVVFPEETTCREPFLMKFSPLFSQLSDQIAPVAIKVKEEIFYGTSPEGDSRFLDILFFLMNPRPGYEITFLEMLPEEWTRRGGRTKEEIAGHVQRLLEKTLGFHCTCNTLEEKLQQLQPLRFKKVGLMRPLDLSRMAEIKPNSSGVSGSRLLGIEIPNKYELQSQPSTTLHYKGDP